MSSKYLGQPFDIHMGGVDLIFPHHTNEIAQSEAAYNKKFCNYWVHNAHLIVNGDKMSKSLGNFFTLRDLLKKGYEPLAIRYELLSTHYRQKLDFREKDLEEVKNNLQKFKEILLKLDNAKVGEENKDADKLIITVKKDFEKRMDDDLNISAALSAIYVFIREINKIIDNIGKEDADKIRDTLLNFDSVLGIMNYEKEDISAEIRSMADMRLKARKEKNWKLSDELRDKLKEKGYQMDDTKDGYILKKI
jgi:cysteinyl-tRNA synthetase